jgi:hypothetical protein
MAIQKQTPKNHFKQWVVKYAIEANHETLKRGIIHGQKKQMEFFYETFKRGFIHGQK